MKETGNLPPVIYKYESFNNYSLSNLKNAQIFLNRPVDFNDPFDCSLVRESFSYCDEDLILFYNLVVTDKLTSLGLEKPPGSNKPVESIEDVPGEFKALVDKTSKEFAEEKQKQYLYRTGCSCFSEINDNLLMWSHYSDGHRGFCLEFDTSFNPFNKALKVGYSDSFPRINPIKMLIDGRDDTRSALAPLLTKYSCWDYEKEWRLYHREPRKLFVYEVDALKAVYFGASIEYSHFEIICLILQGQNPNVAFYKGKRSASKYKIEFELVDYIPHKNIMETDQ